MTNASGDPTSSASPLPASTERVVAAAAEAGLPLTLKEYPDGTRTADDAAQAVGCSVAQIVKSMVFDADGELILALTSGANLVDGTKLAAIADVPLCGRADVDEVRRHTGFAIGGVAPFGHLNPVRTWIDPALLEFTEVWAAAGTPRHVFPIAPAALIDITGATAADFVQ